MREHVDLEVSARGAGGVEFTLRAPARARSPWRSFGYALWLAAAASASAWHAQPAPRHATAAWLAYAAVACGLLAYLLQLATGAVVVEESVLVVPSLGVQLRRRTRSGATTKRFLDASDIRAVVVNEGFVFSDVVYYIAFMVHSKDDMVLAFEHFRPRIAVLQEIFVNMRQSLFPEESKMRLPHLE